jgi:hypothetical protein
MSALAKLRLALYLRQMWKNRGHIRASVNVSTLVKVASYAAKLLGAGAKKEKRRGEVETIIDAAMELHPEYVTIDAVLAYVRRDLIALSRNPRRRREYIELAREYIESRLTSAGPQCVVANVGAGGGTKTGTLNPDG